MQNLDDLVVCTGKIVNSIFNCFEGEMLWAE